MIVTGCERGAASCAATLTINASGKTKQKNFTVASVEFFRVVWFSAGFHRIMSGMDSIPIPLTAPLDFRLARSEEAPAVASVINAAFRKAESFFIDTNRIDLENVQTMMEKGNFLIAGEPPMLAGCVYVEIRGERAYLGLLSVAPGQQQRGLGSLLMQAAEDYCARAGCKFIDLQIVNLRQELPSFYRRRGYVENGTSPFPAEITTKIPCHFIKMSKSLT